MANGMTGVPVSQKTPVEERRQAVKTRTLGRNVTDDSFRQKIEAQRRSMKQDHDRQESEERAEKHREQMLAKVGARRHLRYDVIDDAAIVQVSVINSEDGTVVRKVPPDKVVEFVRLFKKSSQMKLDVKL